MEEWATDGWAVLRQNDDMETKMGELLNFSSIPRIV
jgi:hypothetical protein